ncbi:MAG: SRPBCC family protein, partial [Chloroflexota bacterium]
NPELIKQFMFGTEAVSDWKVSSPIVWKGVWQGKHYEDKGRILKIEPPHVLQYSHFSPLSGAPDIPENYHTLTYTLTSKGDKTLVELSQDNNSDDKEVQHSTGMWEQLLVGLKKVLEEKGN